MNPILRNASRTSVILFIFAIIGTAMMAYTFRQTRPIIEKSEQAEKLALIDQVLPKAFYDNDLLASHRELPADDLLGTRKSSGMWLATKNNTPSGIVLEAIAPEGYSGDISLLIGITAEGVITGVRVTKHKETPGLGDYIEFAKSRWVLQFNGKRLEENEPAQAAHWGEFRRSQNDKSRWRVKKDGGEFDSRAGATITPRAIVKAVRQALEYFHKHRDVLLKPIEASPV
ncbi:MAG: electron transport complex subunit RsxG [Hydrogenophilaceae bacterium]|nr:electron transport complex subunit RsxG [Hydrogenophilaceae bacterium]